MFIYIYIYIYILGTFGAPATVLEGAPTLRMNMAISGRLYIYIYIYVYIFMCV